MTSESRFDVVIIGGGPAGSTTGAFLKKYCPELAVAIFEREQFPRDHVGESLLPAACTVLYRMGCWDAVEAAGFPVKIGATYRWGSTDDLWDFDFLAGKKYEDSNRPAPYAGQREKTAFQVDRSIFDKILLDFAAAQGVEVRQQAKVAQVHQSGRFIDKLVLQSGEVIQARYYIDASGHSGIMRRELGIPVIEPSALRNMAVWRYWNNAEWAVTVGSTATRVQVLSLGWGWIWVIPITATRTSIGLVLPVEYYKNSGEQHADIYRSALESEPNVCRLLAGASAEAEVHATKDWSFVAAEMAGENWLLVGESGGFADPILAAGISLTLGAAQEAAITIAEFERGNLERSWLRSEFDRVQKQRLRTHIRFADYWYTANTHFTDLIEYAGELAGQAGVALRGRDAWQWLGTGGFVQMGGAGIAGFNLAGASWIISEFENTAPHWQIGKNNVFDLSLEGAAKVDLAVYHEGFVEKLPGLVRGERTLPARGPYRYLVQALKYSNRLDVLMANIGAAVSGNPDGASREVLPVLEALEAMIADGWVIPSYDPRAKLLDLRRVTELTYLRRNTDNTVKF